MDRAIKAAISAFVIFVVAVPGVARAVDSLAVSYPGPAPFYIPVVVALKQGFFRDQNLDIKLIVTRSEVDRAALVSGDIDFTLRISSTILSAARGLPVRTVFVSTLKPFWAMVARPETQSVRDLKDKVVGIGGIAGAHHVTTKVILKKHGVDPDREVVLKFVGPGERIPAVLSKSIDGVLMDYGEALRAKKLGLRVLVNSADYYSLVSGGVGATVKTIRERPELLKRFLRAHVQGIRFMREQRAKTVEAMAPWLKVDRDIAEGVYDLCVNNFTREGFLEEATLKPLVDEQLGGLNIKDVQLSQLVDFAPLQQVLKEGR